MVAVAPRYTNEPFVRMTNLDDDSVLVPADCEKEYKRNSYICTGRFQDVWFCQLHGLYYSSPWEGPFPSMTDAFGFVQTHWAIDGETGIDLPPTKHNGSRYHGA